MPARFFKTDTSETECTVRIDCVHCETMIVIEHVDRQGLQRWTNGTLIQKALPDLSPSQREAMISGFCSECFDNLFNLID